jgi:hypothetical protein
MVLPPKFSPFSPYISKVGQRGNTKSSLRKFYFGELPKASLSFFLAGEMPIKMAHCNPEKRKKNMGCTPHLRN